MEVGSQHRSSGNCHYIPLGMIVGGISGYFGGWVDGVVMRLVEVLMMIPAFIS